MFFFSNFAHQQFNKNLMSNNIPIPPKKFTPTFNDLSPPENENLPIPPFNSYFEKCSTPPYDQGGVHTMSISQKFDGLGETVGSISPDTA